MEKYKHGVSFRLEKRKDKNGNYPNEMPINADITFGGKRIWYYYCPLNHKRVSPTS